MNEQILVIEDAPEFQIIVREMLTRAGYQVSLVDSGAEGVALARTLNPDVILLDLGLPDAHGLDVCRELRTFTDAYLIMVTGLDSEFDTLEGLAAGADDYVTKPFSTKELVARIGVALRRPRNLVDRSLRRELGDVVVDPGSRELLVDGVPVPLTKTEFDLLDALTSDPTAVSSRESLMEAIWGPNWVGSTHLIDVHLGNLRKKLDANGHKHIATVRGVGYRFASAGPAQAA